MTVLGVAFTGSWPGCRQGCRCCAGRSDSGTGPARRLAFLAARDGTGGSARTRPRARFLRRLRQNPWAGPGRKRRRERSDGTHMPVAADLLAACLASGADPQRAAEVVAYCLRPPGRLGSLGEQAAAELADRFQAVAHAPARRQPSHAWPGLVAGEPGLRPVAEAIGRAGLSGAPAGRHDPGLRNGSAQGTARREHRRRAGGPGCGASAAGRLFPARLRPDRGRRRSSWAWPITCSERKEKT